MFVFFMSVAIEGSTGSDSGLKRPRDGAQLKVLSDRMVEPGIEICTSGYKVSDLSTTTHRIHETLPSWLHLNFWMLLRLEIGTNH